MFEAAERSRPRLQYDAHVFTAAANRTGKRDAVSIVHTSPAKESAYAAPAGARNPALGDAVVPVEDHPYELLHVLEREQVLGMLPAVGGWIGLR